MSNYWAIAIGINQYLNRRLPEFMYAQRDAQSLFEFWVNEASFEPDHCRLFSDISPAVVPGVLFPTRNNIEQALTQICQQGLQPEDFLWVFFSGHGLRFEGKDYLLPIDAEPDVVASTAIALEDLVNTLKTAPTRNILLTLDMNRGQLPPGEPGLGTQTIDLAHQAELATVLSCAPDQVSHETLGLRQGLFTTALLEGLRYEGCVTLEHLVQYLNRRLPELSEHHWRPRQEPRAVIPADQRYQLIFPGKAIATPGVPATVGFAEGTPEAQLPATLLREPGVPSAPTQPSNFAPTPSEPDEKSSTSLNNPFPPQTEPSDDSTLTDADFRKRLLIWGGAIAALLFLGVLLSNWAALFGGADPDFTDPVPPNPEAVSPLPEAGDPLITPVDPNVAPVDPGADPNVTGDPAVVDPAIVDPNATAPNAIAGEGAVPPGGGASPGADPAQPDPAVVNPVTPGQAGQAGQPGAALAAAQTALNNRNYGEALRQLDQVPADQRPANYNELLQQAAQGSLREAQAAISRPRDLTAINQASDFNYAIRLARRIQPNHPLYREAQADISRWSAMILELAESRASQPNRGLTDVAAQNYNSAIAAAQLVPRDRDDISTRAQQQINQWSQAILSLAQARAQEGDLNLAIRAAEQVPPNTAAYDAARQAIVDWRSQLPPPPAPEPVEEFYY